MIPISQPDLGRREREYLLDAFESGWISSRGPYVDKAERSLTSLTGAPFAAVCSNGTTALHLALLAAGVTAGDEVIIPSLSYIATLNAVYYLGAEPVIVDVLESTWCIDPAAVEAAIGPRTKVIMAVDLYGQTADYVSLRALADEYGLLVVADAAESIGATLNGVPAGALADISTFSFFGNKVITSGEGGAVTTASPEVHANVLQLRNQGNHPKIRYFHEVIGYNYRMTNLAAAILTAQLERADDLIARRRRVVEGYRRMLGGILGIRQQVVADGAVPTPWMYSVRLSGCSAAERDVVIQALGSAGFDSRPVFQMVQAMPFVPKRHYVSSPIAEVISREGISLPTFPALGDEQIKSVSAALLRALQTLPATE